MTRDESEMKRGLIAYLQGYGGNNPAGLSAIATCGAWPALAARESERRMAQFLESLPLDEVQAIAQSKINLNELAGKVLSQLNTESPPMAMPQLSEAAEQAIENIGLEILDVESFELRQIRSKDYREIPVWILWRALRAAYLAGMVDHHRNG